MTEFSPELQGVLKAFETNYINGGVEACRAMVSDLRQEAELVGAVADGATDVDNETIELQTVLSEEEVRQRLELTRGVTADQITALSRHSFALFLLNIIEGPDEEEKN